MVGGISAYLSCIWRNGSNWCCIAVDDGGRTDHPILDRTGIGDCNNNDCFVSQSFTIYVSKASSLRGVVYLSRVMESVGVRLGKSGIYRCER